MKLPDRDDRVLIISPHPDDESIACSSILASGAQISVAFVTMGEGAEDASLRLFSHFDKEQSLKLGNIRKEEALLACKSWSIPEERVLFLGFPDGYLKSAVKGTFSHPFFSVSPWGGHDFSKETLYRGIKDVVDGEDYTHIFVPHPQDNHPDHKAVGSVASLAHMGYSSHLWYYCVSRRFGKKQEMLFLLTGMMKKVALSPRLLERKREALSRHKTQAYLFDDVPWQFSHERFWRSKLTFRGAVMSALCKRCKDLLNWTP